MLNVDVPPHKKVGIPEALEAGINPTGPEKLEGPAIVYVKTGVAGPGPVQRTPLAEPSSPLVPKQLDPLEPIIAAPVRFRLPLV